MFRRWVEVRVLMRRHGFHLGSRWARGQWTGLLLVHRVLSVLAGELCRVRSM